MNIRDRQLLDTSSLYPVACLVSVLPISSSMKVKHSTSDDFLRQKNKKIHNLIQGLKKIGYVR